MKHAAFSGGFLKAVNMKRKSLFIILASVLAVSCVSLCIALPLTFSYQEGEDIVPATGGFFPAFHYNVSLKWKRKREEKKDVEISYRLFANPDEEAMEKYHDEKVIRTLSRVVYDEGHREESSTVLKSERLSFKDVCYLESPSVFTDSFSSADLQEYRKGGIYYAVLLQAEDEDAFFFEDFNLRKGPIGKGESYSCPFDVTVSGIRIRKPEIPENVQY